MEQRKKIYSLILLCFLVLSVFVLSISVVSAPENEKMGPQTRVILDPVKDMFTKWVEEGVSVKVAKYLFIVLLILLIWSILDMLFHRKMNALVKWMMALIIGFLAGAYLTPNEVWALLTSYSALGITLLFLLPVFILSLFSFRMIADGGAYGVIAQYILWIIYFLFLISRLVLGFISGQIEYNTADSWIFVAATVITAAMVLGNGAIRRWLGSTLIQAEKETVRSTFARSAESVRGHARETKELGRGEESQLFP